MATGFLAVMLSFQAHNGLQGKTLASVQKALDKKIITAKALCGGGLTVSYAVTNLSKDSVTLMLPAGWRFNSNAGKTDYQDILVAHDQLLVLRPKESRAFGIRGYCCEADRACPVKGAPYTVGKMADSSLVKIALFLNAHPADENTEQYAVWSVSNNRPTAEITSGDDSLASLIRTFVAALKHEALPWFTLLKKAQTSSGGQVQEYPVKLKATLSYEAREPGYSYFYVLDSNGIKVGQIIGQWLVPAAKNEYRVNLDLKDFKKGSYKLVLETKASKLIEKEFTI
jgi:hypothetical protein